MKRNSFKILYATLAVFCVFSIALVSCSTEEVEAPPFLKLTPEGVLNGINFGAAESQRSINVSTNVDGWSVLVEPGATWLTYEKTDKSVIVKATENKDNDSRKGSLTVKAGSLTETIKIEQLGIAPAILVGAEIYAINAQGGEIEIEITSNIDYDIIIPETVDWITEKPVEKTRSEMIAKSFTFDIPWNTFSEDRSADLFIKHIDGDLEKKITIIQGGQEGYDGGNTTEIEGDYKILISGANASASQSGENITRTFDDNFNTLWHSPYNRNPDLFPITIEYYFKDVDYIDYFIYYPRSSGENGLFKETEIWVASGDDTVPIKIMDFDFEGKSSPTKIIFEEPVFDPKTIRIVIKSGVEDFASCAEMAFYQINPYKYDPLDIFSDETCSELKQGITLDDIYKIEKDLYKNIAFHLYNGTYPSEFRI